jgi:hypothetical protein
MPLCSRSVAALGTAAAIGLMAACAPTQGTDLSRACPRVTTSGSLPECTVLHDGSMGLRLPAGTAEHPYGAISRGGESFITSDGTKIQLKPKGTAQESRTTDYASTVYRAEVTKGVVSALTPVLKISENAVLTHAFGSRILTGRISVRNDDGSYDFDRMLPVAIQLDEHASKDELGGTIANATRAVRLPSGRCLPSLSQTPANPLVDGFTAKVSLARVPSMHVPFDDELILQWNESSSGMGSDFYPSIATVMGRDRLTPTWTVTQHGNPSSGPSLTLRLASGHVSTC